MRLMTKELEKKIPKLYETENIAPREKIIYAKFFNPCGIGTWLALEYDKDTKDFFGYVDFLEKGLGYFSLEELESVNLPFGLKIERDKWFKPMTLGEYLDKEGIY